MLLPDTNVMMLLPGTNVQLALSDTNVMMLLLDANVMMLLPDTCRRRLAAQLNTRAGHTIPLPPRPPVFFNASTGMISAGGLPLSAPRQGATRITLPPVPGLHA